MHFVGSCHGMPCHCIVDSSFVLVLSPSITGRHNDGVSNHRCLDCFLNLLFRCRSKKTSKLRVTGLCEGNPSVTGGFPSPKASNTEKVSISWRHHDPNISHFSCHFSLETYLWRSCITRRIRYFNTFPYIRYRRRKFCHSRYTAAVIFD